MIEELGRSAKGVTDRYGELSFGGLPPGKVWVESTPGASTTPNVFATTRVSIFVVTDQETVLDLCLASLLRKTGMRLEFFPLKRGPSVLVSVSRDKHEQRASLPAGEYQISITSAHPAFLANNRVKMVENGELEVRVHVYLGGMQIRGRVLDPTGQGVGGVDVIAQYRNPL